MHHIHTQNQTIEKKTFWHYNCLVLVVSSSSFFKGVFGPKPTMNALKLSKTVCFHSSLFSLDLTNTYIKNLNTSIHPRKRTRLTLRASVDEQEERKSSEKRSFLTLEEAGLVEMSGLSSHEGFLCRLTVC